MNRLHFACFGCRKCYKQPDSSNWDEKIPVRSFKCPECKNLMDRLGKYFKAPRSNATRQWLKVELLYQFGERFESSNTGLSKSGNTLADAIACLIERGYAPKMIDESLKKLRATRRVLNSAR